MSGDNRLPEDFGSIGSDGDEDVRHAPDATIQTFDGDVMLRQVAKDLLVAGDGLVAMEGRPFTVNEMAARVMGPLARAMCKLACLRLVADRTSGQVEVRVVAQPDGDPEIVPAKVLTWGAHCEAIERQDGETDDTN